ncbi:MAG: elongation factor G [Ardenticatenales bacterium]|nr:elongation factor G [Ardenticatenales bacterium]
MKSYQPKMLRNVALISHGGAGKTSIAEALLYQAGVTNRRGRVEDRNTVSDFDPEEQRRGISVNLSVLPFEWRDHKINLIDSPGYLDFVGEARSALRVADSALIVVDAISGAEVGTELMWEYADERQLPRMIFINKMDRDTARYERALESLQMAFNAKLVPIQMPIGQGHGFKGVVDLITRRAKDAKGQEMTIPPELKRAVDDAAIALMESAAEGDDDLILKYLDGEELTADEVCRGLKASIKKGTLVPVLVGSAEGVGMAALADAMVELLPSPEEAPAEQGQRGEQPIALKTDPAGPLAAFVFKTVVDPYGTLSIFHVYSGTVKSDSRVRNQRTGEEERIGQLFLVRGKEQIPVERVEAGDIGGLAKLSATNTGDTLGEVAITPVEMPQPVFAAAVLPHNQSDIDKLTQMLGRVIQEDPSLRWVRRLDTRQLVLAGMGDTHLDVARHRLERLGVHVDLQTPQVAYKETVSRSGTARYRHKKQTGGAGQFGEVDLRVEPLPRGSSFEFGSEVFGGAISHNFIPSIEKGIRQILDHGVMAGFPVVDVKAIVTDGKEHPVDSKDIAFQIAGREAFKQAFQQAQPVLLEPIYNVTITVPEQYLGDVMGDLNTRRGRVMGMEQMAHKAIVHAQVPESQMLRYAVELRSMTQGHGLFSMEFDHYDPVPEYIAKDLIANAQVAHAHE